MKRRIRLNNNIKAVAVVFAAMLSVILSVCFMLLKIEKNETESITPAENISSIEYIEINYENDDFQNSVKSGELIVDVVERNEQNNNMLNDEEAVSAVMIMEDINKKYYNFKDFDETINSLYIVDSSTKAVSDVFRFDEMIAMDLTIGLNRKKPQILIYHTHASEAYKDSRAGVEEDTVVGVGSYLKQLLEEKGYVVLHDKTAYDRKDGKDNRNYAYSTARPAIEKILEENPSIEIVIDLHRDSGEARVAEIDGVKMAKIMLFNGLSRDKKGPIDYLYNKNITANLAFSLRTKLFGDIMYPGLFLRIYLKNYRYNMHLCEKYMLVENGTVNNTVQEAKNSMVPFAEVLHKIISQ